MNLQELGHSKKEQVCCDGPISFGQVPVLQQFLQPPGPAPPISVVGIPVVTGYPGDAALGAPLAHFEALAVECPELQPSAPTRNADLFGKFWAILHYNM